ncbi:retrovirus-related Pol polyprotein from type-1 retrotransposable element R2, partial [Nephila pilipes]
EHIRKPFVPRKSLADDTQAIQKAYSWKRRKCIRELVNPNPSRCHLSSGALFNHFNNFWSLPEQDSSPDFLPLIVEDFSKELVCECLIAAENTTSGPDKFTYKHCREIYPKGKILSKLFNICLSLKRIPSSWKSSTTILIHKKGTPDEI